MKKPSILLFFYFSILNVFSQDVKKASIYLSTGTEIVGKLISATDDNINFSFENGNRTLQRVRVLIAFNDYGRYLVVDNISRETEKSRIEINNFYNSQNSPLSNDIIFKAVPFEIISCNISYDKDAINYLTLDGKTASINRDNVLAIIRQDGSHEITRDVTEVAPILGSNMEKFNQIITPAPVIVPIAKKQEPKVENEAEHKPTETKPLQIVQEPLPILDANTKLTEKEKQEYSNQATDNVLTFKDYLNRIGDKRRSPSEKRQDIRDVLELFTPEATIEVTSKNRVGSRKLPIAQYLSNLSNLNYSSVEITYANLRFISELNQAPDGNYYGIVRGEQTFKGIVNGVVKYGDVVDKNYRIKVESLNNIESGKKKVIWKVLLGDVSVSQ